MKLGIVLFLFMLLVTGCIERGNIGAIEGKRVLFIIAHENFRDEELFDSMKVIKNAGGKVIICSTELSTAHGMKGGKIKPDISITDVNVSQYDAIIFIGGYGASIYFSNETALEIAKNAYQHDKIVGAICIAPCILAYSGILNGKNATVYPTEEYIDIIESNGANFINAPVVKDGKIITARNPSAANDFAKAIINALS